MMVGRNGVATTALLLGLLLGGLVAAVPASAEAAGFTSVVRGNYKVYPFGARANPADFAPNDGTARVFVPRGSFVAATASCTDANGVRNTTAGLPPGPDGEPIPVCY